MRLFGTALLLTAAAALAPSAAAQSASPAPRAEPAQAERAEIAPRAETVLVRRAKCRSPKPAPERVVAQDAQRAPTPAPCGGPVAARVETVRAAPARVSLTDSAPRKEAASRLRR